ncbi:hypothetical protein SAMN05421594_2702 [Chryseobacterium oleae]|uniref:Lipoprotein n=1 Tax=Chryseobacterium oleae TaxID=491207 RepID=A0A1I4YUV4_CHROL|nr:hypothetical protein [Chryseobacterium oleae]SFN41794.1 hypothetical protein SAMN05421594_2702 [Chryseobacterium oleae]
MKKFIPIISSVILLTSLSCRQTDSIEEDQKDPIPLSPYHMEKSSKTDTTDQEKDPPIKDGQDWRLYNQSSLIHKK